MKVKERSVFEMKILLVLSYCNWFVIITVRNVRSVDPCFPYQFNTTCMLILKACDIPDLEQLFNERSGSLVAIKRRFFFADYSEFLDRLLRHLLFHYRHN